MTAVLKQFAELNDARQHAGKQVAEAVAARVLKQDQAEEEKDQRQLPLF